MVYFVHGEGTQRSGSSEPGPEGRAEQGRESRMGEDTRKEAIGARPQSCVSPLGEGEAQTKGLMLRAAWLA